MTKLNKYSSRLTQTISQPASKAMLYAIGMQDEDMGKAQVGDKTLIDTLAPALQAYRQSLQAGAGFREALQAMEAAAEAGKESTRHLQARIGRSARLGPRSIGVLDAGATSCWLILSTLAQSLQRRLAQASA